MIDEEVPIHVQLSHPLIYPNATPIPIPVHVDVDIANTDNVSLSPTGAQLKENSFLDTKTSCDDTNNQMTNVFDGIVPMETVDVIG